jgi:phosphoserine phosphatase
MDSTVIQQECIDELADMLGIKAKIAAITECAMRGEIAFVQALRKRVGLLKGLSLETLEKVYRERITETPGGRTLVHTMHKKGYTCILVSSGFTFFTKRVAHAIGFIAYQANRLLLIDDKLSGNIAEPIVDRETKIETLIKFRNKLGLAQHETLAVGDGANDIGMLERDGLGIAFHAKPIVVKIANARIDHGDLTALLYLQGYREDEFVND